MKLFIYLYVEINQNRLLNMIKTLLLTVTILSSTIIFQAQETPDSTNVDLNIEIEADTVIVSPGTSEVSVDSTVDSTVEGGNLNSTDRKVTGVAVSPAHFHLAIKPGGQKSIKVKLSNNTDRPNSFKMRLMDFQMNNFGKSQFIPATDSSEFGLSKWINIAPTFVELQPGEKKTITLVVSVPDDESGQKASWCVLLIEQEKPRESLSPEGNNGETIAFGIVPTFAFGVYIYQNPPIVNNTNVEIINFRHVQQDTLNGIYIEAENAGNGIAYCTSYIDITNLETGTLQRLMVKRFTILPSIKREFKFLLPSDLQPGTYGAIGVIDYESAPEIQAAKLKFKIE
jgi:hypothetical protein